jgi:hypothetical protein
MLTLKNSFHNTEYRTTKTREELDAIESRIGQHTASRAEKDFARKVRRALCGIDNCKCGTNVFDER